MTKLQPWLFDHQLSMSQLRLIKTTPFYLQDTDFIQVLEFTIPDDCFNFIPVSVQSGLIYPKNWKFQKNQKYLWGVEIRQIGVQNVVMGRGFRYKTGYQIVDSGKKKALHQIRYMQNYVNALYPRKSTQTDPVKKNLIKLLLNSLYGKFGQRAFEDCVLFDKVYHENIYTPCSLIDEPVVSVHEYYNIQKRPKQQGGAGLFVRVAAYITALSRLQLAKTANIAGVQNVYYCDTDSLYVNDIGRQNIQKNGITDPKKLGAWKYQESFVGGVFIAPKHAILVKKQACKKCGVKLCFQCFKTVDGRSLTVKWKGVPKYLLKEQNVQDLMDQAIRNLKTIFKTRGNWKYFNPMEILRRVTSQRWLKKDGVTIERFVRKTNINLKRFVDVDGNTRGFSYDQMR